MKPIPAFRYYFPQNEIELVIAQFKELLETNSFLSMGRHCAEFEQTFAQYVDAKFAVSVSSGTAALEIILRCLGVEGREVIVPTNTFAATAFAVIHAGGQPVFADCLEDMTLDPSDARSRITQKTAGIVTVHIGGMLSPATSELVELADRNGIPLIEDAAHAHGSQLDEQHAGTFGVAGAFSFFSTKVMTTGEGGMIVTDDQEIFEKALVLRDQAKLDGGNYHRDVGSNWRMTEFQALLGLSQLRALEASRERRSEIAKIYDAGFFDDPVLASLSIPDGVRHSFYKYIVFLERRDPKQIAANLKNEYGISLGGNVYDVPCHLQPAFKSYGNVSLPMAEDLCGRHICPPIFPTMTDDEAHYVVDSLRKAVR